MTTLSISPPFPIFSDRDGSPLENGYIWVGTANVNPITNPIAVYWDAALTQPAALPVRTINGYPANSGTPGRLFTGSADYSLTVQDSKGSLVYSALTSTDGINQYATLAQLAASSGSSLIGFEQAGTGTMPMTVQDALRHSYTFEQFGAVGDNSNDDTAEMQAAIDEVSAIGGGKLLGKPGAEYKITSALVLKTGVQIDLCGATIWQHTNNTQIVTAPTGTLILYWSLRNGYLRYVTPQDGTSTVSVTVTGALNAGDKFVGLSSGAWGRVVSVSGGVLTYLAGNGVLNPAGESLSVNGQAQANSTSAPVMTKGGLGLRLANGAFSYLFIVDNIQILDAYDGITCPPTSNTFAFVGQITNYTASVARWAINYDCDSAIGGNTNVILQNCWHIHSQVPAAPFSSGFRFNACAQFRWDSVLADKIEDQFLFIQSSSGKIGTISLEASNLSAVANLEAAAVQFSDSSIDIETLLFVGNTFQSLNTITVTITGTIAPNDIIVDNSTGASGRVVSVSGNRVTFTQNTRDVDFANGNSVLVGGVSQGTVAAVVGNSGNVWLLRATSATQNNQYSSTISNFVTSGNVYRGKEIYDVAPTFNNASPASGPFLIYNTQARFDRTSIGINVTGTIAVGNTITGATSGASGEVTSVGQFRFLYKPSNFNAWQIGENVLVGGVSQGTILSTPIVPGNLADFATPPSVRRWNGVERNVSPDQTYVDSPGYIGLPQNAKSAAYTLVFSDAGKSIVHPITDNNARTFTIPANGSIPFPVGTEIVFVNMINTVTIAITTDTMYLSPGGATGSRTLAAFGRASAIKVTSTSWVISGSGLT